MLVLQTSQNKILTLLQKVSGIVEKRHTLPILANVLLSRKNNRVELTTSDLEIQVHTYRDFEGQEEDFKITVNIKKLMDILKSLSSDHEIILSYTNNKMILNSGGSRFTLQTLPASEFPLVNEAGNFGQSFKIPQKNLKKLIDQVHFSMAMNDIRYYLNGILFIAEGQKLTVVATDGHRLALAFDNLETELPRQEVILPRKTVLELQRLLKDSDDEIEMSFSTNQARFNFGEMTFITKLVEGKFPDFNRVIPKNHQHKILIGRENLLFSLQRAAILTSDKFKGVRINLEKGLFKVTSTNSEQEEAKEELEIDYNGEMIEIGFNVNYLIEVLLNMSKDMVNIELQDSNSSALFTIPDHEGFKYVVMPMRI